MRGWSWTLAGIVVVGLVGTATGQDKPLQGKTAALPIGTITQANVPSEGASWAYKAEAPGVLSVVVRAEGDSDLVLLVTDEDGQTLQGGRSDQDLGGARGAEQAVFALPAAGNYIVRVDNSSSSATKINIGATWLAMPQVARPADADGRPRSATALEVGKAVSDQLDPSSGDLWDWYAVQASAAGTLTVLTKAPEGDLVLECYQSGNFRETVQRSDQDMGGVKGNESASIHVDAGQTVFFRVVSLFGGGVVPYKISSGLIPD